MPETLTAPAPVATPSASPAPSPSPAPVSPPASSTSSLADDAGFKQKMDAEFGGDEPAKTPAATPTAPEKKPDAKPAAVTPPAKPAADPKPTGPKELREELERVRTENATFKKTSDEMAAKIKEGEARGKDVESLKARLEQRDKEFESMQGELRALKREASPEFKKQYETPMVEAVEYAKETVASFVRADDPSLKLDWDRDFAPLYQLAKQNVGVAAAKARELFGDDQGPELMSHIKDIMRTERSYTRAMEQEKKGWEDRAKAEEGRKVQMREQEAALWKQVNEDLKNTVADYKDPVDDAELATARSTGIALFDEQPKSRQEHLVKSAHIRHRLGAYEAQKLQIARHTARIAELESKLEETKTRQPGATPHKPGGDASPQPEEDWGAGMIKAGRAA